MAPLTNSANFGSLEVLDRDSEIQLQVAEYLDLLPQSPKG